MQQTLQEGAIVAEARSRKAPYVWATGLSKVLAGENHCQWATWFRAHHQFEKRSSDLDRRNWMLNHTRLVDGCAKQLEQAEYTISFEGQNAFQLKGGSGTVFAGCPDIVAVKGDEVLIVDCKTGKKRISHEYQVLLYMLTLPYVRAHHRGKYVSGLVQYEEDSLHLPADRIDDAMRRDFRDYIFLFGGNAPPRRVPSIGECRFCDIPVGICPERIDATDQPPIAADDLF